MRKRRSISPRAPSTTGRDRSNTKRKTGFRTSTPKSKSKSSPRRPIRETTTTRSSTMEHRLGGLARDWQLKAFYVVLALGFFAALGTTLHHYPLFPLQLDSKEWLAAWLLTTCGDYYVLAFCLSTIIASTETRPYVALCWILAINLLGSAFFALYLLYRVTYYGTVALALKPNYAVDGTALLGTSTERGSI